MEKWNFFGEKVDKQDMQNADFLQYLQRITR